MVVFSKITAVVAGLSSLASALPTQNRPNNAFSINQIASPRTQPKTINIPAVYASALAKYGGTVPASLRAAADHGSVVTTPEPNDVEYLTPVTVGGSTLHLDFDTGSADLYVPCFLSVLCENKNDNMLIWIFLFLVGSSRLSLPRICSPVTPSTSLRAIRPK